MITISKTNFVFGSVEPKPLAGVSAFHSVRVVVRSKDWARMRCRRGGDVLWYVVEEREGC